MQDRAAACYHSRMTRPFRILGLQQIAVGAPDKEQLKKLWVDILGVTVVDTYRNEKENVDEDIAVLGKGPTRVEIDLMQPVDPDKRPKVHDPALNHLGAMAVVLAGDVPAARVGRRPRASPASPVCRLPWRPPIPAFRRQ